MTRRWSPGWLLLLLVPLAAGVARLRYDVDILNLLPPRLPEVEGLKLYQRHFARADELILTVQSESAETTEAAARQMALALRRQTNLVSRVLWQSPGLEHPEQMAELLALTWLNQPADVFLQLADRLDADSLPATLEAVRNELATSLSPHAIARLGYDPLGLSKLPEPVAAQAGSLGQGDDLFRSRDGTFRLLFLKPAVALPSYRDCAAWLQRFDQTIEQIRLASGFAEQVRLERTGAPAFVAEIASGMERDMSGSASGALLVVAGLFWWAHRRWLPLAWLTALLALVLGGALALGGLIYGTLNVISLGFAAILIGLADDYPAVLYQEALDHPRTGAAELRKKCAPAIAWSAVTTAAAFLLLNFSGLPGLAQLGTLVALGILLAAIVMLYGFLPVALKRRPGGPGHTAVSPAVSDSDSKPRDREVSVKRLGAGSALSAGLSESRAPSGKLPWLATGALLVASILTLWHHPPIVDHSSRALTPTASPAHRALRQIETHLAGAGEPLWLLVSGRSEVEVAERMRRLAACADAPEVQRWLGRVTFPTALWPHPNWQQTNRATAARLCQARESWRAGLRSAGFNDEAFRLADSVLRVWERVVTVDGAVWPTSETGKWLLEKAAARTDNGWLALGMAQPTHSGVTAYAGAIAALGPRLVENEARLTGWSVLSEALLTHTAQRLCWLLAAMVAVVGLCLWLVFRNCREVLLSFLALAAAFLALLTLMSLLGWSWNLMNLMAAPLILGAGVDYTIHTQLALRRNAGDIPAFRRTTGRALLLASATSMVGFGSLAWAGNPGLAGLGRLCAAGLACALVVSIGLLPAWWRALGPTAVPGPVPGRPSALYRREIWWLGLRLGRVLPLTVGYALARGLGLLYWHLQPRRRAVVIQNLLPACEGNRDLAARRARRLFQEFALKVVELWRFECGAPLNRELRAWSGWERLEAAQARGRGVLLVTPHLGNWEVGGAFVADRGLQLVVLTQAEPGGGFTALRQAARARWKIETIVVGEDPFAFVEVIKRLQNGRVVALLLDRPAPSTAVTVELFGRPFHASIAAAELARTTGCAVLPVYVVREADGYAAHILPEVVYERASLGQRDARLRLTQEILRAFEPVIRQHVAQWYHFVPIWPEPPGAREGSSEPV